MPKSGEIQLVISAVSDQAKKELDKLSLQYNKLVSEQEKLTQGTEAYAKKAGEIDKVREKMSGLAKQIESGNIASLDRLTKAEKAAERELRGLVEGTEDYIRVSKRLEGVRADKAKLKDSIAAIGTEMQKAGSGFKAFAGGMGDSLKSLAPLGAAAIGAFAVDKILEFGKGAISAFNEAENAAFQMHNALVVLGGESEETFQRLMDQADALEMSTFGFTAEQIQATQKQLKLFDLTGAEIEKLTPKILDYATATGKDLASATDDVTNAMLGKDKALQKVGIHLDKTQLSVQGVTNSLDKFAGTATSALDVGTNKMEVMADKWGHVEEVIGEFLVNAGFALIEWFTPVVEGLADIWAVLVRVYDVFQESIAPVKAWFGEMAKSYPWLNKVKDAIVSFFTPLSSLGATLKMVGMYWQMLVAGAIAGTKTIKDVWTNLGAFASNLWGNLGDVISNVFSGNFSAASVGIDKLKATLSNAGKEIAGSFVDNYEAEMAKFKPMPEAKAGAAGTVKDRKIKDPEAEAAAKKAEADAKKAQEKAANDDKKASEDRLKLRNDYFKRVSEADKAAEDARIALMSDSFTKEKALLAQKASENLLKLAELDKENTENKAISEEERAVLAQKYAANRLTIEQNLKADLKELEVEHQNDLNKAISEADDRRFSRANEAKKTLADINILQAKDEISLINAKMEKVLTDLDIELQNEALTAEQKVLIRAKAASDIAALEQEAATGRLKRLDEETKKETEVAANKKKIDEDLQKAKKDAAIAIAQAGIGALLEFSQMETDKKVAGFEKEKDARIKSLDSQLAKGKISEKAYAKAKEKIEADATAKINAIKTEQAKKDKAAAIVQALINTAVAVTAGMATPAVPPFPSAIAAGILGALQIGLIAAKPLPTFARGGVAQGGSHAQGGIKMFDSLSGRIVGEMEGGEPYMMLSKNTYGNNKSLIDRLLYTSMYKNGAPIFAKGGVLAGAPMMSIPQAQGGTGNVAADNMSASLLQEIALLRQDVQGFNGRLQAYILFSDLEVANKDVAAIRKKANS